MHAMSGRAGGQERPLTAGLTLPVIVAPMFLVSGPELVIASAEVGFIGAFPAQNARTLQDLEDWCGRIIAAPAAAQRWAVGLIVHPTYDRREAELDLVARFRPPLIITALGPPHHVLDVVHGYGGKVFADVISLEHARKAVEAEVDGLVAVCAGAGGHTGSYNPFAFMAELRRFWSGTIVLSGAIADARSIRAAEMLGADLVYMGTRFAAAAESLANREYRELLLGARLDDIVTTRAVTGVAANWIGASLTRAGYDPARIGAPGKLDFSDVHGAKKPWRDIFGAGHGVGAIRREQTVSEIVAELVQDYRMLNRRDSPHVA